MQITRRSLLRGVLAGGLSTAGLTHTGGADFRVSAAPATSSAPTLWSSVENFSVGHPIIRDGGAVPRPDVRRRAKVAIVGAGPSGLVAGYRLRNDDILIIEKEPAIGGNARADSWRGEVYAAGSHAFYGNSPAAPLYDELGLEREPAQMQRAMLVNGREVDDLWDAGLRAALSPADQGSVRRARAALLQVDANGQREQLDRVTFTELLRPYGSGAVLWFNQLLRYFAADCDLCSGYGGLHFARAFMGGGFGPLYPERQGRGGVFTFRGGLHAAAEALATQVDHAGAGRLVTDAVVFRVEHNASGVEVHYLRAGQHVVVQAEVAVIAAPKFIARRIVVGLPDEQARAMERMVYSPYVVGAVGVEGRLSSSLRAANVVGGPIVSFIDTSRSPDRQLLRIEMPLLPRDRPRLLQPEFVSLAAGSVVAFFEHLFPGARRQISDVRLWLRGHNWYLPVPGMLGGFQAQAARPFGRIVFANADSLGPISDFGWAMLAADRAVGHVRRHLVAQGRARA